MNRFNCVTCGYFVLVCFGFTNSQKYVGDSCTSLSNSPGTCKLLSDCQSALDDLMKKHIYPKNCGFEGDQPIVCCENQQQQKPKRQPGEISKAKCAEYAKYTTVKERPPILLIDVEETETIDCGHDVVELIVGGELAKDKEFPHMAELGYNSGSKIMWACGGSLISEDFILTAAHCLKSRDFGFVEHVKIGTIDLANPRYGQQLRITERIAHPDYKSSSHYNDIALVKMHKRPTLGPKTRPACLYTNAQVRAKKGIATGFGKTQFAGEQSDKLLKVTLDFFQLEQCNYNASRKLLKGVLYDSQVCAGSLDEEKDTCQGDSGGPLQVFHIGDDVKCMYDVVGVTSFGKACSGNPGVYTRVSKYVEWIESVVWP